MTKTFSLVSHKYDTLSANGGFAMFLTSKLITCFYWQFHFENEILVNYLFTQWKWTYILDFGPWKWSALNMGYMDKHPSRMQGSGQGRGARGSNFFGVAPTCHPDQCNARQGYLERPLYGLNPSLMIAYKYSSKHIPWCVKIIFQLPTINLFETTITIKNCNHRRWLSITFFISITMFCGTDNILWNIVNTTKYFYGIE